MPRPATVSTTSWKTPTPGGAVQFTIPDKESAEMFVYKLGAKRLDALLGAACEEGVRALVYGSNHENVMDLVYREQQKAKAASPPARKPSPRKKRAPYKKKKRPPEDPDPEPLRRSYRTSTERVPAVQEVDLRKYEMAFREKMAEFLTKQPDLASVPMTHAK